MQFQFACMQKCYGLEKAAWLYTYSLLCSWWNAGWWPMIKEVKDSGRPTVVAPSFRLAVISIFSSCFNITKIEKTRYLCTAII